MAVVKKGVQSSGCLLGIKCPTRSTQPTTRALSERISSGSALGLGGRVQVTSPVHGNE
jgi:hypothetical protein